MKCPACGEPLREKSAGGMTLDVCYGGCGGIWFDATELERVDARAATTLHTIWQAPPGHTHPAGQRMCPRCAGQVLDRKWFSDFKKVEIDQCPKCAGIWLDAGEFTRIYEETKGGKVTSPLWASAMAEAAAGVDRKLPAHSGHRAP
jgi:Zn-finger nucleic acid-binding protein